MLSLKRQYLISWIRLLRQQRFKSMINNGEGGRVKGFRNETSEFRWRAYVGNERPWNLNRYNHPWMGMNGWLDFMQLIKKTSLASPYLLYSLCPFFLSCKSLIADYLVYGQRQSKTVGACQPERVCGCEKQRQILKCVSDWTSSHNFFPLSINITCISCFAAKNTTFIMSLSSPSHILQSALTHPPTQASLLASHLSADTKRPHIATSTQGNVHCSFSNYPAGWDVLGSRGQTSESRKPCCRCHHHTVCKANLNKWSTKRARKRDWEREEKT